MRFHFDLDHEVAGRSHWREVALLTNPQVDPVINSLGDRDGLFHCVEDRALSAASHARVADHLARAVTVAAHLLDGEGTLADRLEPGTTTAAAA